MRASSMASVMDCCSRSDAWSMMLSSSWRTSSRARRNRDQPGHAGPDRCQRRFQIVREAVEQRRFEFFVALGHLRGRRAIERPDALVIDREKAGDRIPRVRLNRAPCKRQTADHVGPQPDGNYAGIPLAARLSGFRDTGHVGLRDPRILNRTIELIGRQIVECDVAETENLTGFRD